MGEVDAKQVYDELYTRWDKDFIPLFNDGFRQAEIFTEDCIFLPQGHEVIYGREGAMERNRATAEDRDPKCTHWDVIDIAPLNSTLAYTIFNMECVFNNGKSTKVRSFSVWKKIDGVWWVHRDSFNWC